VTSGYYTDEKGKVLGYWELDSKPIDTNSYKWIESEERPPIQGREIIDNEILVRNDALNALIDEKIANTPELKTRIDLATAVKTGGQK